MIKHLFHVFIREARYKLWFYKNYPKQKVLDMQRSTTFAYAPRISILVPVYNTPIPMLEATLSSVFSQTYTNWELCIADGSPNNEIEQYIHQNILSTDSDHRLKVKYIHLTKNLGISENTNAALALATGEYICLLDHDDLLAPSALFEIVHAVNEDPAIDILYSDEDKINYKGTSHSQPYFKSDFNIDLLRSNNYICHLFTVRRSIATELGGFRKEYDGAQDYDFILRCVDYSSNIFHIPKILYHWRIHQNSVAANPESKTYAYEAGKRALLSHFERNKLSCDVTAGDHPGFYQLQYFPKAPLSLSIILHGTSNQERLTSILTSLDKWCMEQEHTAMLEVILLNSSSNTAKDKKLADYSVLYSHCTFVPCNIDSEKSNNFQGLNKAAFLAKAPYLLFLDANASVSSLEFLTSLLGLAQRQDVGAVGTRLLNQKGHVLSAGYYYDRSGFIVPGFHNYDSTDFGYYGRLQIMQNISLLSSACFMIRKDLFLSLHGFDPSYTTQYGVFDLCLKLKAQQLQLVLAAKDTISLEDDAIYQNFQHNKKERQMFFHSHSALLSHEDCFYNPNCSVSAGNFDAKIQK